MSILCCSRRNLTLLPERRPPARRLLGNTATNADSEIGGPLFAGVVLVFFMVKPFFARRARHNRKFGNRDVPVSFAFRP